MRIDRGAPPSLAEEMWMETSLAIEARRRQEVSSRHRVGLYAMLAIGCGMVAVALYFIITTT